MKLGALLFIIFLPTQYAIYLQLLGGVWMLQTLPTIVIGLYTRWFHRWALLSGWAVGMVLGTAMAASQGFAPTFPLALSGLTFNGYTGLFALVANLVVAVVLTPVFSALGAPDGEDETSDADYENYAEAARQAQEEPSGLAG